MDIVFSTLYYNELKSKNLEELSLAEHAEMWCFEQGNPIPDRNTGEWVLMYEKWVGFAFGEG